MAFPISRQPQQTRSGWQFIITQYYKFVNSMLTKYLQIHEKENIAAVILLLLCPIK
jgi:hypothetical protein